MMFSIIIPVYNREHSILKAIQSVLSQTYTKWELLIVNDCSTDNTLTTLSKIKDERIKIINLEKNSGAAGARNAGIKASKGEYISLLDSDDYYDPYFLEESLKTLEGTSAEVGFMWTGVRYIDRLKNKEFFWRPLRKETPYNTFLQSLQIGTNSGITFKQIVFHQCGLFNQNLPAAEDTDYFLRITQEFDYTSNENILINIERDNEDRLSKNLKKIASAYNEFMPNHFSKIDEDKGLMQKFYYKLMWLNYHLGDRSKAHFFYNKIPKDLRTYKVIFIKFLYEFFPLNYASLIHQRLSS